MDTVRVYRGTAEPARPSKKSKIACSGSGRTVRCSMISGHSQKNHTRDSNVVPHRSTNLARQCLTSLSRREAVLSLWYGGSCWWRQHFVKKRDGFVRYHQGRRVGALPYEKAIHLVILPPTLLGCTPVPEAVVHGFDIDPFCVRLIVTCAEVVRTFYTDPEKLHLLISQALLGNCTI